MSRWKMLLLTLFFSSLWLGGGLAIERDVVVLVGAGLSLLWLLVIVWIRKKIIFPRYFIWFGGLVVVTALSMIWSLERAETAQRLLVFVSGGLWWLGISTIKQIDGVRQSVKQSVWLAGALFTILWLLSVFSLWQPSYGSSSLVVEASVFKNHNHIGDWWMVMMILALSGSVQWQWIFPGLVMVWISRSRSASVGLLAGGGYFAWLLHWWERHRKKTLFGMMAVIMIFMMVGLNKTTFGSRDYFVQVIAGLKKYPLGAGWGNFGKISIDSDTHWWGLNNYSSIVHCLPLEWLAGMGWLGLVGWVWLGLTSWHMGFASNHNGGIWRAAYWALLANFCLDTTYFIPSMWWLWMMVIGLGEE